MNVENSTANAPNEVESMKYLSLSSAARSIPPDGVDPSTVSRWIHRGLRVGGRRIRLRAEYFGRKLLTTSEWLAEFRAEVTEAKLGTPIPDGTLDRDESTNLALRDAGLID